MAKPAVFLDRDGTLNIDKGYVHRVEEWEWIPGAIDAIAALKNAGFLVVVVTNQAGVARGYYTEADIDILHGKINEELKQYGAAIDRFYYCPHHPEFGTIRECDCRKPNPGMIYMAQQEMDVDLAGSWLVGDKMSDIQSGMAAGLRSILVLTGYGHLDQALPGGTGLVVNDIAQASDYIIACR